MILTEPVTCSSCGDVSVNGGTVHCHRCFERAKRTEAHVEKLERSCTTLLCERDAADGWASLLAGAIAAHFRVDIGEHSDNNNPWDNALKLIDGTFPPRNSESLAVE